MTVIMAAKTLLVFILYLFTWYTFGAFWNRITHPSDINFTRTMTAGMCLHALLFMAYVLPLKFNRVPLNIIARIWIFIWIGAMALMLVLTHKSGDLVKPVQQMRTFIRDSRGVFWFFAIFSIVQIGFVLLFGRWSLSTDPAEYIAYVTTAVYTNSLGTTDQWTGLPAASFNDRLVTETFVDHSAVLSKIFNLHPLMEIRWVVPVLFLIMGNLIMLMLARTFCQKKPQQILFFSALEAGVMLTAETYLLEGYYYYFRNYEGKNYNCAVLIPALLWVFWQLYHRPQEREALAYGVLTAAGAFPYTGTAMYLVPVMCLGLVPAIFWKGERRWRILPDMVLLSLPSIVYMGYYEAVHFGLISLAL